MKFAVFESNLTLLTLGAAQRNFNSRVMNLHTIANDLPLICRSDRSLFLFYQAQPSLHELPSGGVSFQQISLEVSYTTEKIQNFIQDCIFLSNKSTKTLISRTL